jgi:hypothetical protein
MGSFFGDDDLYETYNIFNFVMTILSAMLSILTILLIQRMNVKSGHLLLLLWISYFQLIYDLFSFTTNSAVGYYINVLSVTLRLFSLSTSLNISNWMSFIAFRVIFYRKLLDAYEYFNIILFTSMIPGITFAIIYMIATIPESKRDHDLSNIIVADASYHFRNAVIVLNFLFSCAIFYKLYRTSSKSRTKTTQEKAIRVIAVRIVFYPVFQLLGRIGHIWYEYAYGGNTKVHDNLDSTKLSCALFTSFTTALISLGYFLIPLLMQPGAYRHFQDMIRCKPRLVTLETLREHSISENILPHSKRQQKQQKKLSSSSSYSDDPSSIGPSSFSQKLMQGEGIGGSGRMEESADGMNGGDYTQRDSQFIQTNRLTGQSNLEKRFSILDEIDFAYIREEIEDPRYDDELS